jgi:ferritin-like metal-binding protein YciE
VSGPRTQKEGIAVQTLRELFEHELRAAFAFEDGLVQALQEMADESARQAFSRAFLRQMKQSQRQVRRLEKVGTHVRRKPGPAASPALDGVLREKEAFVGTAPTDELLDFYNLQVVVRLAEYAAAVYEGLVETAGRLQLLRVGHLLRANLEEKRATLSALRTLTREYEVAFRETGGVLQPVPSERRGQARQLVSG